MMKLGNVRTLRGCSATCFSSVDPWMSNTAIRPKSITKRPHNETREMMLEWGGLSRVDGSARFAFGESDAGPSGCR